MNSDINILRLCLTTPGALTPVVVGSPGIGKTQRIKKLAAELGWDCEVLSPGERGEGAFGVVPVPNDDGFLHYPPPDWVKRFAESWKGLVFVDEINTAPPALQPALLGLILDGRIGGYQLPPGVKRAAAMNPVSQAAAGWDLPPALANRMQYLQWASPSATEWTDWLLSEADGGELAERSGWTQARALAAAFHRKNPGRLLEDADKALVGRFPPAFATPRSWETAVRMLASCIDAGEMDAYPIICEGILGKPVAVEWCTWLRKNDLPDPEKLLADPSSWKPDPKEMDKVFATCFAVSECVCSVPKSLEEKMKPTERKVYVRNRFESGWRVLNQAMPLGKGMVAIGARRLTKSADHPQADALSSDVRRIIVSMREVLQASGM